MTERCPSVMPSSGRRPGSQNGYSRQRSWPRKDHLVLLVDGDAECDVVRVQRCPSRVPICLENLLLTMKNKKATKKFAASGKLKQTIHARHKQQKLKKQVEGRRQRKAAKEQNSKAGTKRIVAEDVDMDDNDNDEVPSKLSKISSKGKSKAKPQKMVEIKSAFLDGEDDEVRRELIISILALNGF